MGLFDETNETPSNRHGHRMGNSRDTLFDWLVRRAETDLGVAQALAAGETQRADQIKRLETTLIGQINKLQHQILESREVELNDLKSEIFACTDRMARIEGAQATGNATKEFVQEELSLLRAQLTGRQAELENRYAGCERLGESLGAQIRVLEEHIRDKLDSVRTAQGEMRHFKSEAQSLAERIAHAESATWQARTLALRNAQQLEQTTESLTGEIVALKALCADLNDQQRNSRLPDTVFKEIAQDLAAKIEDIQGRLAQDHHSQLGRDARLGHLDVGLATLAERMTKTESLSRETHALTQTEIDSASDFRKTTAQELEALRAKFSEPMAHETAIRELELSLRAKIEEWQHDAAKKFMLMECRAAEEERSTRELAATLGARLGEQEARIGDKLRSLANDREELLCLRPEIQTLTQRIESEAQRSQARFDASANLTGQLEEDFKSDIAVLKAEFAKLADQQGDLHPLEEQLRDIESKLAAKVDELQRQLSVEREGFDHWGKGLRESFGSELSAIQARLSERQSQIEHSYARLERWEQTVNANIDGLEKLLKEKLRPEDHNHEEWGRLQAEMGTFGERTSQLELRARQAEDGAASLSRQTAQSVAALRGEISAIEAAVDQHPLPSSESIIRGLEETLRAKLRELEEQLTKQFIQYDSRDSERARQAEQTLSGLRNELGVLKAAVDGKHSDLPTAHALSATVEKELWNQLRDLDQSLAERFTLIDSRDAERSWRSQESIETLQRELSAIKTGINECTTAAAESSIRGLEKSLDAKIQELQQQVAQKLILLEKRDAARAQQAEQVSAGFTNEMAALRADLIQRLAAMTACDPALRGLEETLSAKIQELHQQMAQKFSAFDSRDAELNELKERSQSLIQRVTQLSGAIQSAQSTVTTTVQAMAVRAETSAPPAPPASAEGSDSPAETRARSEKEQLIKLQERMSSEIERVRAELKERSGRWKVRKSAS